MTISFLFSPVERLGMLVVRWAFGRHLGFPLLAWFQGIRARLQWRLAIWLAN